MAPSVARLGRDAPPWAVQTARLLQAAGTVPATFAVPFSTRPDPGEDDVALGHRFLLRLTAHILMQGQRLLPLVHGPAHVRDRGESHRECLDTMHLLNRQRVLSNRVRRP